MIHWCGVFPHWIVSLQAWFIWAGLHVIHREWASTRVSDKRQDGIDLCQMSVVNESLIKSVRQEFSLANVPRSLPDVHLHANEWREITTQTHMHTPFKPKVKKSEMLIKNTCLNALEGLYNLHILLYTPRCCWQSRATVHATYSPGLCHWTCWTCTHSKELYLSRSIVNTLKNKQLHLFQQSWRWQMDRVLHVLWENVTVI